MVWLTWRTWLAAQLRTPLASGTPSDLIEVIESHQQEKGFADPIPERGIISDDGGVVLGDIDEEVREW